MALFVFSALGARGHLHAPVAVAKALRERGHRVALYTSSHYRHIAEKLDFEFLPPRKWRDFDFTYLERYWPELAQFEAAGRSMQIYFKIFMGTAMEQAHDLLGYSQELQPDVLVTEPHAFGTQIVALKSGTPWAVVGISLGTLALPILGQRGVPLSNQPFLYIAQGVPSFDAGKPNILPQTHYVGICQWDEGTEGDVGGLDLAAPPAEKPLVFVSQGTMWARETFFKRVIEAAEGQPWQVLLSTSHKIAPESLAPLPPNVRAVPYVPYSQVWREASLAITHGSAGALLGALGEGLPLIVTPIEADQPANANVIAATGAGLRLSAETGTSEELRDAINQVLTHTTFRARASYFREELSRMGGASHAADLLEELAVRKQPLVKAEVEVVSS
jgi:UDP:flavonoid glycosyltransferase YjiC (YdhE family)